MSDEAENNPTPKVGRIWFIIGIVTLICPVAVIAGFINNVHQNVLLLYIAIGTVFLCGWIISVGMQLMWKYDFRQR